MFLLKDLKEKNKKYSKNYLKTRHSNEEFTGQVKKKKNFKLSEHFCRLKIQSLKEIQKLLPELQIPPTLCRERIMQLQGTLLEGTGCLQTETKLPKVYGNTNYTNQNSASPGRDEDVDKELERITFFYQNQILLCGKRAYES